MCIHGIEEKCVQSERAPRVKYSYEPTKKKRRRETVCKERETLARPSPTFFPLPQIFLFFFLFVEGETKDKKQTKKIPSSKGACACLSSSVSLSSSLLKKKRVVCVCNLFRFHAFLTRLTFIETFNRHRRALRTRRARIVRVKDTETRRDDEFCASPATRVGVFHRDEDECVATTFE